MFPTTSVCLNLEAEVLRVFKTCFLFFNSIFIAHVTDLMSWNLPAGETWVWRRVFIRSSVLFQLRTSRMCFQRPKCGSLVILLELWFSRQLLCSFIYHQRLVLQEQFVACLTWNHSAWCVFFCSRVWTIPDELQSDAGSRSVGLKKCFFGSTHL